VPARLHALHFPLFISAAAFLAWTLLRVALWFKFRPAGATGSEAAQAFAVGVHLDVVMALTAPILLISVASLFTMIVWLPLQAVPRLRGAKPWRAIFTGMAALCCMSGVFLLISEWYFFDEFESRFNCVAIDYLLYPHEVFTNIRESYPVPLIVAACSVLGGGLTWLVFRFARPDWRLMALMALALAVVFGGVTIWQVRTTFPRGSVVAAIVTAAGVWLGWRYFRKVSGAGAVCAWFIITGLGYASVRPAETNFSPQRVINELAGNGWLSAINAAITRDLSYRDFYVSLPLDEGFRRARRLLAEPGATFSGREAPPYPAPDAQGRVDESARQSWLDAARLSLVRDVAGDPTRPRLNVCILLEESLGAEFWGVLGGRNHEGQLRSLTPEMDQLATSEGLLFTNILADGNRTIRGFEGVFSSFPPLPGDSILARDKTGRVETIARVLQRDGYHSLFLYAGHGTFDYITSYTQPNGWDGLVEEKDFSTPAHRTAWGVSDEDL